LTETLNLNFSVPPISTLFPYTTLFRSRLGRGKGLVPEPIIGQGGGAWGPRRGGAGADAELRGFRRRSHTSVSLLRGCRTCATGRDRKSTRLNSSHVKISYAVFCLKKKK